MNLPKGPWPHISKRIALPVTQRMDWSQIQGLNANSLPLNYAPEFIKTTESPMSLKTLTHLHRHCYYLGSVICEVLLELKKQSSNWHLCLLLCLLISVPSVIFLKFSSDLTNFLSKIPQWLPIANSIISKPLRMTHKFLCNQSFLLVFPGLSLLVPWHFISSFWMICDS